jgi:hypothetical protein
MERGALIADFSEESAGFCGPRAGLIRSLLRPRAFIPPATMSLAIMTKIKRSGPPAPEAAPADAVPLAARRPMARATRIGLFEREVRERPARAALDLLFARAQVISEGQRSQRGGRDAYFGSTMLTFDLPALSVVIRDACDAGTAMRLAALLEADSSVAKRVQELAKREAARVCGAVPREVSAHVAIRAQGAKIFIDVDVEATFK